MVVFELGEMSAHSVLKSQARGRLVPSTLSALESGIHGSIHHQIDDHEDRSQYYALRVCTRIAVEVDIIHRLACHSADLSPQKYNVFLCQC